MQLVENVLGNSNDPAWKARLADATIDTLELSQWDAQKNRLRKDTRNGQAIAVSLDRNAFLHDGDILLGTKTKQAVICKIDLCEVLITILSWPPEAARRSAHRALRPARHALGNQHWPAIVQNGFVYVPMAVNRLVMNSVMNTHHFKDITLLRARFRDRGSPRTYAGPPFVRRNGAPHGRRSHPRLPTDMRTTMTITTRTHIEGHCHDGHCHN
ncbi:MAG: urease accessory protein UreE [Bilophila wadsworthia]